jgi:formylglycine-generating enzyme required for sulfatase activity
MRMGKRHRSNEGPANDQPAKGFSKLETGHCPACGKANSSADRFCHNPDCGEVLIAPCLACKHSVSYFSAACESCGGVQEKIRAKRVSAITNRLEKARLELKSHRYAAAIELSKETAEEAKQFSRSLGNEAVCLLSKIKDKQREMQDFAGSTLTSALEHERKHDYHAALSELAKIPGPVQRNDFFFKSENADLVRKRITANQRRLTKLDAELEQAISQDDTNRTLQIITQMLKLHPSRDDLLKRKRAIEKQRLQRQQQTSELFSSVQALFAAQDYQAVLSSTESAAPSLLTSEIISIAEQSEQIIGELKNLRLDIKNSLNQKNDLNALSAIQRLLSLKSDDKEAIESKHRLSRKLEKQKQKQQAEKSARRRKKAFITSLGLAVACVIIWASLREYYVSKELREAWMAKDYATVLAIEPDNKEALVEVALQNNDYTTALALDTQNPRVLRLKKQHELKRFLATGNYQAALKLDPLNTAAQKIKKDADIQAAISAGDYKTALLIDPRNASAQSLKKSVDIRTLISQGYLQAANKIDETEEVIQNHFIASEPRKNSIGMYLKAIPGGTFHMGSSNGDPDEYGVANDLRYLDPFEIGVHEVSQEQYNQVMGINLSLASQDRLPVNQVNWEDAIEFCRRLTALPEEQKVGNYYRLPTEVEWEYACKAGAEIQLNLAKDVDQQLEPYAWHRGNANGSPHPIGQKQANAWGIHDMKGNVWEWCSNDYPSQNNKNSEAGASSNFQEALKVIRGGSFQCFPELCRASNRNKKNMTNKRDDIGIRIICTRI